MFPKIFRLLSVLLIAGILLGSATFPTSVRADSTITVNTTDDELNTDGDCSLREAIQAANTNAAVDACTTGSGADTITVPAGTYTLTIAGAGENANATGDLDITDSVTINGAGAGTTTIQAGTDATNGIDRVLQVLSGPTVSISDVTIANGKCSGSDGGGIYNAGTLAMTNSTFSGNRTEWPHRGGGIFNDDDGTLTVTNNTFSGNYGSSGIMNEGALTVTNSIFSGNSDGGIKNAGTLTVTNSTFSGNSADYGGGIANEGGSSTGEGRAVVMNSTFSGNSTMFRGGGIYNFFGTLTVTNSTFSGNSANEGGGIGNIHSTMTVTNSSFSGNSANDGGGIYSPGSTLTVTNSTFSRNSALTYPGGGIRIYKGTLTLNNSILANTTSGVDCYNDFGTISGTNNLIETDAGGANACGTTAPIHSDPNLGPLADNGGPTQTFALLPGSPAIDAGDDAICAASPVNNTSQNGVTRPQGVHCDIGSFEVPITSPLTLLSIGTNDGWILESTETSGVGGTMNVNGQAIVLGDDVADKQYRSILHFNTASLPDDAVITKVTLKIKKKAIVGTDPFTTHQYIKVDIRNSGFSNNTALQLTDFQAAASKNWIGTIKNTPVDNWYSVYLNSLAYPYVNLSGGTQFRLYFRMDDDNDNLADYIQFFSGNASAADRPQLIVEYYVP
jgi:CSLREA domain-containing protein